MLEIGMRWWLMERLKSLCPPVLEWIPQWVGQWGVGVGVYKIFLNTWLCKEWDKLFCWFLLVSSLLGPINPWLVIFLGYWKDHLAVKRKSAVPAATLFSCSVIIPWPLGGFMWADCCWPAHEVCSQSSSWGGLAFAHTPSFNGLQNLCQLHLLWPWHVGLALLFCLWSHLWYETLIVVTSWARSNPTS